MFIFLFEKFSFGARGVREVKCIKKAPMKELGYLVEFVFDVVFSI